MREIKKFVNVGVKRTIPKVIPQRRIIKENELAHMSSLTI